ncbi:MAG: protein phosphatase 2C domain-containing protein [Planctomycetales bacterium]|nr:protein phosphatase 2C domain-containing protein [Planctomycetales bacterium]
MSCSLRGPSHEASGAPCQDSAWVDVVDTPAGGCLVAGVADGAGSARFSDEGSSTTCKIIAENVVSHLKTDPQLAGLQRDVVLQWCDQTRRTLQEMSRDRGCEVREFATTLCVAIVAETRSAFFQIGDGAIILGSHDAFGVVFWPQSGEYANSTNFLTADNFESHLECVKVERSFTDVALLTDGMERMGLHFSSKTPYLPFFTPLLNTLRAADDSQILGEELRRFLQSDSVRNRSDDDKTIIVATRCAH